MRINPNCDCAERRRLALADRREQNWQRWGTYLPERQWGTVREDYSEDGNSWAYFPFEMAQYRAYRWGEDGILGWTDRECRLCFSTSLWNGKDACLKERLFGLTNPEGNHGEDVKELYYYLDATPTGSYAKALYKYPQAAFPYDDLRQENARRGLKDREYELLDTGIFKENRYFDLQVEYAKADVEDTLIRLTVSNRGPDAAELVLLPTLTLRNNWAWHNLEQTGRTRPTLQRCDNKTIRADHRTLGQFLWIPVDESSQPDELILTENDSNMGRLDPDGNYPPASPSKDGFHAYVVGSDRSLIVEGDTGTKAGMLYRLHLAAGESRTIQLRLVRVANFSEQPVQHDVTQIFATRIREADEFYSSRIPSNASKDEQIISRQAYAGLLWTKQFYYYVAQRWLDGDETQPAPPSNRVQQTRNWRHLFCRDVLSVPDKWEYPWFAAWDTAFHMIPMSVIDPEYAKWHLMVLLREWYMHPNGQLPAYEFSFSDVNPPVHAWAVWHIYRATPDRDGKRDIDFLERAFQKLLLNFTWWVNRNDSDGRNLFGGGFLGLDNIGVFDRSKKLPDGATLDQADGTAWMGLFCSCMLQMAIELALSRPAYEDIASKFFEHYINIVDAINSAGGTGLWDEEEGFYFDRITADGEESKALKVHSIVGLVPILGINISSADIPDKLPGFFKRLMWFKENQPQLASYVSVAETDDPDYEGSHFLAVVPRDRLERILRCLVDETEFLSPHGIRSLSRRHLDNPFSIDLQGQTYSVDYEPAEGTSNMMGGNSNWRGPVWFPINVMLGSSLERYHQVYGDSLKVECPAGSGNMLNLVQVSEEICRRLISLFTPDSSGHRPCHGGEERYANDPYWKDLILFNEYFSGEDGRGVGASHQTGWTAMIASAIQWLHEDKDGRKQFQ